jgi:hypothetical protein
MREESMNGGSTRRLAGGEWSAVGKSDAKGKEDSAIRSFYSRRRGGGGVGGGPKHRRQQPTSRQSDGSSGERSSAHIPYPGVADRWGHSRLN